MYEKELEIAKKAAKEAGKYLRKREEMQVDAADGKDIKLSSDKKSEKIIIGILAETGIPVLSEECGKVLPERQEYDKGLIWIIDPLDGTANYWKGMTELSCVSVALWEKKKPILGVVYRFLSEELFYGIVGKGAFLNGKPICVSDVREVGQAVLATGFPVYRNYGAESLKAFVKEVQVFKKIRMLGAAAIMGAFVAAGRIDVYCEDEIMVWDIAASVSLVEAAGGSVRLELSEDYKCICKCFANRWLMEDYYAKGL